MKTKNNYIAISAAFILGILITAGISYMVYAEAISSALVTYSNSSSSATNVEGALDDLYDKTNIGDATAAQILNGQTALVGGQTVTGTMTNSGAITLSEEQTGSTEINGYVTSIDASNVYNKGKSDAGGDVPESITINLYLYEAGSHSQVTNSTTRSLTLNPRTANGQTFSVYTWRDDDGK